MPPFRILLTNNELLFLQSIKKNLEEIPDIEIIEQVVSDHELPDLLKSFLPDMVILDIHNQKQMELVKQMKVSYPKVKIMILTMEKSKRLLLQAILANVDGYLLKVNTFSDLIEAIDIIRRGGRYFCNIISNKMADIIREEFSSKISVKPLSPMQLKVLILRCESKSYKDIAESLSLSYNTVRNYMVTIKHKLQLKTQSDLMKYAIQQGYMQNIDVGNSK